jgi:hypothetical protein
MAEAAQHAEEKCSVSLGLCALHNAQATLLTPESWTWPDTTCGQGGNPAFEGILFGRSSCHSQLLAMEPNFSVLC